MIRRYHHIGITVSDLDRSISFYRDMLGFRTVEFLEASGEEVADGLGLEDASLKLVAMERGDLVVELIEYSVPEDKKMVAPRPCDVGCMHIALEVDDIHGMYEDLLAQGVRFNTSPKRNSDNLDWAWWCYTRDPDGVPIELVQVSP